MSVAPPILVAAPTLTPARFGLSSAADQVLETDPHMRNGVEWETSPAGPAKLDPADCGETHDRTVPEGIPVDQAGPIVVYNGFTATRVGLTEQIIQDRAQASLATEWVAVEQAVWGSADPLRLMEDGVTTALTDTPVSLVAGIAMLEAHLGAHLGGVGVIHAPRLVAPYAAAAQQITPDSGRLTTVLGTRFAFGAGYPNTSPDGTAAADGTAWLVATGPVTFRRTVITTRKTFNSATNAVFVIAERTYVVAWDDAVRVALPITLT